jgi:hypothetical protein
MGRSATCGQCVRSSIPVDGLVDSGAAQDTIRIIATINMLGGATTGGQRIRTRVTIQVLTSAAATTHTISTIAASNL